MTGAIAEFLADWRGISREKRDARRHARLARSDPFVDADTLPPEVVDAIGNLLAERQSEAGTEHRVAAFGREFTIRRRPRIRLSRLKHILAQQTELAAAGERAARGQTAKIEAENDLALAKARAGSIEESVLLVARADVSAEIQWQFDQMRALNAVLSERVANLTAEAATLKKEIARLKIGATTMTTAATPELRAARDRVATLTAERDTLLRQISQLTSNREMVDEERADLHRRLTAAEKFAAEAAANTRKGLADNDALTKLVKTLRAEEQRIEDETRRWKAQAQGDARAAARDRAENATLRATNAALAADKQVLEDVNWWLTEKLRFRGRTTQAA